MKYLVLLIVLVVVIGVWRSQRRPGAARRPAAPPTPALPQDMLACRHCGLHVPRAEALIDSGSAYCCPEHARRGPG